MSVSAGICAENESGDRTLEPHRASTLERAAGSLCGEAATRIAETVVLAIRWLDEDGNGPERDPRKQRSYAPR
jgi:hypothetical protein